MHWSPPASEAPERVALTFTARIEHRPTPHPIVHVKPQIISTPRPITHVNPAPAAPKRAAQKAGAAKSIAHTVHHIPQIVHVAVARIARGGPGLARQGSGTGGGGTSRGNGTGAGGQGTGTGSGGSGTGSGGYAASNEPCGYVEFIPHAEPIYDKNSGAFHETIRMIVHYPDGHVESTNLDWQWYYPTETADPWSAQNLKNPNFVTLFQRPPPDKGPNEPPIVQYVMQHSTPDGFTLLKDCPPAR